MTKTKNKGGRPKKDLSDIDNKFEAYKIICKSEDRPFTIEGFCVHLEISKQQFYERLDEFPDSYKKCFEYSRQNLMEGGLTGKYNPAVTIFLAKNNFGFKDKQEVENTNLNHEIPQININKSYGDKPNSQAD